MVLFVYCEDVSVFDAAVDARQGDGPTRFTTFFNDGRGVP